MNTSEAKQRLRSGKKGKLDGDPLMATLQRDSETSQQSSKPQQQQAEAALEPSPMPPKVRTGKKRKVRDECIGESRYLSDDELRWEWLQSKKTWIDWTSSLPAMHFYHQREKQFDALTKSCPKTSVDLSSANEPEREVTQLQSEKVKPVNANDSATKRQKQLGKDARPELTQHHNGNTVSPKPDTSVVEQPPSAELAPSLVAVSETRSKRQKQRDWLAAKFPDAASHASNKGASRSGANEQGGPQVATGKGVRSENGGKGRKGGKAAGKNLSGKSTSERVSQKQTPASVVLARRVVFSPLPGTGMLETSSRSTACSDPPPPVDEILPPLQA
eukprot:TRINITY_DN16095_c0_g1_i2.p1 TRINITY_DN16095_c0_g1~~TRINITY_DN16095_c0_g1_i2.p1  ORF type:complete len:384 (-),score=75.88 TRINITY_DN16095_c0_g1_i2:560-1552(-)